MAIPGKGPKQTDEVPRASEHYRRYPEEMIIDELEAEAAEAESAGAELAEEYRAVNGKPTKRTA